MSKETKFMSYKKQMKLREGDIVVLDGVKKPGIVKIVDKEDMHQPVRVEFTRDGSDKLEDKWSHPPIIRRFPRIGEKVVIKRKTELDSHGFEIGEEVNVIEIELDEEGGQELKCSDGEVDYWVYESGVKRVKKGKAGACQ